MEKINGYSKEEAMERAFKLGFEAEKNRFCCSQSTYNAIADVLGIKNEDIFRSMNPLEAGGGGTCNSCGSFSAACSVIGYFLGRPYEYFMENKDWGVEATMLANTLEGKYREKFGSVKCGDILKSYLGLEMDWLKPDMYEKFEEKGGHSKLCPTVVGLAAAWTVDLLWDKLHKDPNIEDIPDLKDADNIIASLKEALNV